MIKNLNKQCFILLIMVISIIVLPKNTSNAVLQANGNEGATYSLPDFMKNVRKMEELGGTMGLSESINDDLTANGDSNNIDVHMQKNTEYGALVILSASSYGNPNKIEDGDTTTGNVTGAVMKLNKEWVAAAQLSDNIVFQDTKSRYKNSYITNYVAKRGDAIEETQGWHGSKKSVWLSEPRNSGLIRACDGSLFSYDGYCEWNNYYGGFWTGEAYNGYKYYSRAVIVSGEGI